MTTFRLSTPPKSPGIYALKNRVTGHIYVGQTRNLYRRFEEWRGLLRVGVGKASKQFMEVARASKIDDWDFTVVARVPLEEAGKKLDQLEVRAIKKIADAAGTLCLNCAENELWPVPLRKHRHMYEHSANDRKSTILDEQGNPMAYGQVAERLGITHQAVKKRMQTARSRGVFQLRIEDLVPVA